MKRSPLALVLPLLVFVGVNGCSSGSGGGGPGSGGRAATGGNSPGSGGSASGGQIGTGSGGSGGSNTGGAATGGAETGGAATGGMVSGSGGQSADAGVDSGTDAGRAGGRGGNGEATDGGNGGGTGGSSDFNPCPALGSPCKIMPLGDSITYGSQSSSAGYRTELFKLALMNGKQITFVGRDVRNSPETVTVNGVSTPFPKGHEGYSGYRIDNISSILSAALAAATPHIITLMIGTNDVNNNTDIANMPTRLGALMDRITSMAPNALLVVAKIVPTNNDSQNATVRTYNDAIPGLVASRVATGKHIIVVDMYAALTANANYKTALKHDSLHPNDAGYLVMAQTWYAALKSYLR